MAGATVPPWPWGMVGVPVVRSQRSGECQDECWYEGEGFQNCLGAIGGGKCILIKGSK